MPIKYKRSSRWYTGEGINRNVYLHIVDNLHIDRYETYITTPHINTERALIKVETEVCNDYPENVEYNLTTDIISPDGKGMASRTSKIPLDGKSKYVFHQEIKVLQPKMWDIDSPKLYKAVSKIYKEGKRVDDYETTFGVREIEFNP